MKEIIELAIGGEWNPRPEDGLKLTLEAPSEFGNSKIYWFENDSRGFHLTAAEICSDPLFWQALGRQLGWDDEVCDLCGGYLMKRSGMRCGDYPDHWDIGDKIKSWHYQWRCFIDHLASGGDSDTFFRDLLTHKKEN